MSFVKGSSTIIIGAGMGGLAAAISLAGRGESVTVIERASAPGGKMRRVIVGGVGIDAGPTVLTLRHVFDEILAHSGQKLDDLVTLIPMGTLARHAWPDGSRLDLFADIERSAEAIGDFAGRAAAHGYRRFCADSALMFRTLDKSFMRQPRPDLKALFGRASLIDLHRTKPFSNLWSSLGGYFRDPRLRQLFARYSTYVGSSPFLAPATLMLIANVEQAGVWRVKGGMHELALALARAASHAGVTFCYDRDVTRIETANGRVKGVTLADGETLNADAVIFNGDVNALAHGLLGLAVKRSARPVTPRERSLSALVWTMNTVASGFPLEHHNVFFSRDYRLEFDELFRRRTLPSDPTIYICAQDRQPDEAAGNDLNSETLGAERLLCLVNAPARGNGPELTQEEIAQCEVTTLAALRRHGLSIEQPTPATSLLTGPTQFHQLFPATGGALYGQSSHGWRASLNRQGLRTGIQGLYRVGGSVHPGAGVPMAALSGMTAAACLIEDRALMSR